jgi:hypothetical protein
MLMVYATSTIYSSYTQCISLAQLNALSCLITEFSPSATTAMRTRPRDVNLTALSRRKSVYDVGGVTLEIFFFVYLPFSPFFRFF